MSVLMLRAGGGEHLRTENAPLQVSLNTTLLKDFYFLQVGRIKPPNNPDQKWNNWEQNPIASIMSFSMRHWGAAKVSICRSIQC